MSNDEYLFGFEFEMPGANEEYQYALELIKNIVSLADDLDPDVFMETMMIYSTTYHLALGGDERLDLLRSFLTETLQRTKLDAQPVICH